MWLLILIGKAIFGIISFVSSVVILISLFGLLSKDKEVKYGAIIALIIFGIIGGLSHNIYDGINSYSQQLTQQTETVVDNTEPEESQDTEIDEVKEDIEPEQPKEETKPEPEKVEIKEPALVSNPEPQQTQQPQQATVQNNNQTQTVYVTSTGEHYHTRRNCRGLAKAKGVSTITLAQAKSKGLTQCGLCH